MPADSSLDHLIRPQQERRWDREAEGLGAIPKSDLLPDLPGSYASGPVKGHQGPPLPSTQVLLPTKYTPPLAAHPSLAACWLGPH